MQKTITDELKAIIDECDVVLQTLTPLEQQLLTIKVRNILRSLRYKDEEQHEDFVNSDQHEKTLCNDTE